MVLQIGIGLCPTPMCKTTTPQGGIHIEDSAFCNQFGNFDNELQNLIHLSLLTHFLTVGTVPNLSHQVYFKKKIWINTVIGQNRTADVVFHYHQELLKYLRGYHKCTKKNAAILGAYIYRARFGNKSGNIQCILNYPNHN